MGKIKRGHRNSYHRYRIKMKWQNSFGSLDSIRSSSTVRPLIVSTEILTTEEIWIGVNVPYVPNGRKLADAIVDEYAMKKRNLKIEKSQNSKRRKFKLFLKDYIERASILF